MIENAVNSALDYPGGIFIALAVIIFLGALKQAKNLSPNVWKAVIVFCSALGIVGFQLMLFKFMC